MAWWSSVTGDSIPIVDRISDAFVELDGDFRFTYLNPGAEELLERPSDQLLGRVIWDEFPETARTKFPEALHRARDEGVATAFEVYHRPHETWYEVQVYPSEEAMTILFRDVTERRERETALEEFAAVVESMHAAVITLDERNHVVRVNESVETTLGLERTDLVGEHVEVIPERVDVEPDDTVELGRAIADVSTARRSYRRLEVPFSDADGERRVGEVRVVPIGDDRGELALIVRDVTDRHEYETVVESLHELTRWLVDADDPVEICSIAVHAGSELLDMPLTGIWLLDHEQGCLEPVAATAASHDVVGGLPRFNPGEGLVWAAFEAGEIEHYEDIHELEGRYREETPIRSEIIAPIGTHGVLMSGAEETNAFDETDVELVSTLAENTCAALDRAERDRVLRNRTDQLERKSDRLEEIADVLATDLRDQLAEVEAAIDESAGWEFPLAEDTVRDTLERTESLVEDVRAFADIATEVGPRSRIRLQAAIERACDELDRAEVHHEDEDTVQLRADEERFGRLLETLLSHLAGADPITVRTVDDDGDSRLVFEGNGEDTSQDGLGLSLVRAIAEAHDWTIQTSETGDRIELCHMTTLERTNSASS